MLSNKFFQAVGVVLVIISFAMVGYAVHVVATNSANMHQPQLTTVIAPHTVQILFGDGKEGLNNRFFLPSSIVIPQGDTVKWINDDIVSHTVTAGHIFVRYIRICMVWFLLMLIKSNRKITRSESDADTSAFDSIFRPQTTPMSVGCAKE